jgi:hypothetical protein
MTHLLIDNSPSMLAAKRAKFDWPLWQLRTPLTRNALDGCPYGLDNGCFSGDLPPAWPRMLAEAETARPLFVALPDIVGDAARTLDLFEAFRLRTNGLPRALVLQDGIEHQRIPWDDLAAVFVGGSDGFKIGQPARNCARVARMLGKWVHVGRVNEVNRLAQWLDLADSIDGSGISRYDHMLADVIALLCGDHASAAQQAMCFSTGIEP